MEMLVIAVVALVAFAAVLVPLFRRRPGRGDPREFENVHTVEAVEPPEDEAAISEEVMSQDELELEVQRYRSAVRADTICRRCGQANPADSQFCFECGAQLPRADAQEFE